MTKMNLPAISKNLKDGMSRIQPPVHDLNKSDVISFLDLSYKSLLRFVVYVNDDPSIPDEVKLSVDELLRIRDIFQLLTIDFFPSISVNDPIVSLNMLEAEKLSNIRAILLEMNRNTLYRNELEMALNAEMQRIL